MSTPHINANPNDFAKTILLPGDPKRAKYIADTFLYNVKEVTNIRGILGFTGEFKGKLISVMGTGMGIPSCAIYVNELITHYKVENLIRIGTCGGLKSSNINLNDIILAQGACTDSNITKAYFYNMNYAAIPSFKIMHEIFHTAKHNNIKIKIGNCFSSDFFYNPNPNIVKILEQMNILCIEMESAALFTIANNLKANAGAIFTVSDIIDNQKEKLSAKEREVGLNTMIELALNSAINL